MLKFKWWDETELQTPLQLPSPPSWWWLTTAATNTANNTLWSHKNHQGFQRLHLVSFICPSFVWPPRWNWCERRFDHGPCILRYIAGTFPGSEHYHQCRSDNIWFTICVSLCEIRARFTGYIKCILAPQRLYILSCTYTLCTDDHSIRLNGCLKLETVNFQCAHLLHLNCQRVQRSVFS